MNSTGTEPPLLECRGVVKGYAVRGREVPVLGGVDLLVRRGEAVVIAGRSGAGKSTLLRILGGLERPDSGSVTFRVASGTYQEGARPGKGRRLEAISRAERAALRRTSVGFVFQRFNLLPTWTAAENVEAPLLHCSIPRDERHERAESLLREVGLGARMDHLPDELSVGEQERVAVARALVNDPALVLADEPAGDVDPETARGILALLTSRVASGDRALVLATHGPVPEGLSATEFVLEDGRLTKRR